MGEFLGRVLGATGSKKERVFYIGTILIALAYLFLPDKADAIAPWIAAMTGAHNIGQGVADGLSGGKTATQPRTIVAKAPAPSAPPA